MSESPTKAAKKAAAAPTTPTESETTEERANRLPPGVWCAYDPGTSGAIIVDSSEMKTLRHAVKHGWRVCHWPYGSTLAEAIAAASDA